jgi:micrococcal nuclease
LKNNINRFAVAIIIVLCITLFSVPIYAGEWYRVKAVIDGDTLLLTDGRFVRYIGINTPEIAHKDKPGEPFGEAATRYNAELVGTGRVQLEYDRQKNDHYGRLLAYVYTEKGVLVNRALIAAGMAYCLYKTPNLRYTGELLNTQIKAMNGARGIWPQLGRAGGQVLGNKRSRRFHRPDCPNARKMSRKNKTYFNTQWQAFRKGYAPGKNCLGGMPLVRSGK